ncbi:hypothetical protein ACB098_08G062500 [Castanea mollissima]
MSCPLICHVRKDPNSPQKIAVKCCEDSKNQNNWLQLKTSIECARWLAFQACAFRGHELIKFTSTFNDKLASVVLENAPRNAKYTSPTFQKEILHILASNVRNAIREEIGDAKFCILVDEAWDESKREKMIIILRFVDKNGFIKERFFHVVHVRDTIALTLKKEICAVFSRYNLHIENIQGQGYDGTSNMRGEWNGLQALFLKECPYAYYVHCMAHKLQLALVTSSREVKVVHQFFDYLTNIINIVIGSSKHNDELQYAQGEQIENMIASNEIETGRGANQIGTLQRARDTRWGSHFQSICSLIKMFNATCKVINNISKEGANYKQHGDVEGAYQVLTLFEFVLILYMMKEIIGITSILCQASQQYSQDLLNVEHLVSTTKSLIQKLRYDGWEPLLASVTSFCGQHEIDILDLNACYTKARGRYRHQDEALTTTKHHLRIDIFTDAFRSFKISDICNLAENYYPQDFTEQEICLLKHQLQHYELDVTKHLDFQNMGTISELCKGLEISRKSKFYHLIDRLIRLVLTLPVSTATTKQAFSAMKLLKTRLRNTMEDKILANNMIVYMKKGNY